jgi:alpha/beta superfamily hydrolase
MPDIRANTVLPAKRRDVVLHTADGLELVGELALPPVDPPEATIVCLHPLPTQGGFMDSHLLKKASYRLPYLANIAVLRFNTRGTSSPRGTSQGTFDNAQGEKYDVAAALDLCEAEDLPSIWLVGWSFGTDLALKYGCDPTVVGAILISPPLRFSAPQDLTTWTESGKPLTALVPEHDDFLQPAEAKERFGVVPQCEVVPVEGAKHLFVGYTERVLDEIVRRVAPAHHPLPQTYEEPPA